MSSSSIDATQSAPTTNNHQSKPARRSSTRAAPDVSNATAVASGVTLPPPPAPTANNHHSTPAGSSSTTAPPSTPSDYSTRKPLQPDAVTSQLTPPAPSGELPSSSPKVPSDTPSVPATWDDLDIPPFLARTPPATITLQVSSPPAVPACCTRNRLRDRPKHLSGTPLNPLTGCRTHTRRSLTPCRNRPARKLRHRVRSLFI